MRNKMCKAGSFVKLQNPIARLNNYGNYMKMTSTFFFGLCQKLLGIKGRSLKSSGLDFGLVNDLSGNKNRNQVKKFE